MAEEEEVWVEGFGTLQATEPTTICDVVNTFSYIKKETPALKAIEDFLREVGYIDGTYDEDGRWSPPCLLRKRNSYGGTFIAKEEADKQQDLALTVLGWNLWDAHIEYRRCCPEISARLRELHDRLEEKK